mgnify:CR=1 FL=1
MTCAVCAAWRGASGRVGAAQIAKSEEIKTEANKKFQANHLNEAIELGKRYGSADSGRFINGVLDRVAQELGRVETRRAPKAPKVEVVSVRGAQGQREER